MPNTIKAACIQLCTSRNIEENNEKCGALIRDAANAGAMLIATPEQTSLMELSGKHLDGKVFEQDQCPSLRYYQNLADELSIFLLIGSLAIKIGDQKYANRSFLIDPNGKIVAFYNKIHMFDVKVSEQEQYFESKYYQAGDFLSYVETDLFNLGQTICFDLRFAKMYQDYAKLGANIITVPAAFTVPTGEAHWHVLLRARAIETNCYILAPAQSGTHENGRKTYGHSLIISPWGEVLAEFSGAELEQTGFVCADLDLDLVGQYRNKMPVVGNEQKYQTQITKIRN